MNNSVVISSETSDKLERTDFQYFFEMELSVRLIEYEWVNNPVVKNAGSKSSYMILENDKFVIYSELIDKREKVRTVFNVLKDIDFDKKSISFYYESVESEILKL
ncbi:MAG: hypothetical protein JW791_01790 [Nanoarchaeota archaeon]|nr:hypothetical protein [Nanoarchaeota archaeon]